MFLDRACAILRLGWGVNLNLVRPAKLDDLPEILWMCKEYCSEVWPDAPFEPEAAYEALKNLVKSDDKILLRSDKGMLGAMLLPMWCAPKKVIAIELFLWSRDKMGRDLISIYEQWAEYHKAQPFLASMKTDRQPAVNRMYSGMGYRQVETFFAKEAA